MKYTWLADPEIRALPYTTSTFTASAVCRGATQVTVLVVTKLAAEFSSAAPNKHAILLSFLKP
jgi:hypothetical protein